MKLRDAAADDLLQALGKVTHQQRLVAEPHVLHAPAAATATAALSTTDTSGPNGQQQQGLAAAAAPPAVSTTDNRNSSLLQPFVRVYLAVPEALLQHSHSWRRSADAATLFKQLFTCYTDLGAFFVLSVLVSLPTCVSLAYTRIQAYMQIPAIQTWVCSVSLCACVSLTYTHRVVQHSRIQTYTQTHVTLLLTHAGLLLSPSC